MSNSIPRSRFLKSMLMLPAAAIAGIHTNNANAYPTEITQTAAGSKLKISLNAYSFNDPLSKGSMNLEDLLEFCAAAGFDAVDLTGYYFPGYPAVPTDEYLYQLKRKAFSLALDISGTGVRNDFANPDESKRKLDIKLVMDWIEVAAKLGAPVIRIFSGLQEPKDFSREKVNEWMVKDILECVAQGKKYGVIVGMQNHNDFIKTADQVETIIKKVDSEWFGLILDIGSYRSGNPFEEIARTAPYAVNWQIKENMYIDNVEVKTDLDKVMAIIKSSPYRGYLPIETLGAGDPKLKVPVFLEAVRKALK